MNSTIVRFFCVLLLLTSFGCKATPKDPAIQTTQVETLTSGIDLQGMNTKVRAQDDFYEHVNGTWLATTELPADRSNYGSFSVLADEAELQLDAIVKELAQKQDLEQGSVAQKIRDYYTSYIAATDRDALDLSAIKTEELASIDAIKSVDDFYKVAGELSTLDIGAPFVAYVSSDWKNPDVMTVSISQYGLTLPDRDYYLKDDERFVEARDLYKTYADTLLGFGGYAAASEKLLAFETQLAQVSWTREQRREPSTQYNLHDLPALKALAPSINWDVYLAATTIPTRKEYVVRQVSYVKAVGDIIAATDLDVLKSYLRFKTIARYSSVLGEPAYKASFEFSSKGLRGVKEARPSWKRALNGINSSMGELLGQLYVSRHFKPEAKTRMKVMVDQLTKAYEVSINELDWMSDATREQALKKLATFNPKIGYPDTWRDYSALSMGTDAVANARALSRFSTQRSINKLDKPVDKTEWGMPPQRVNAYYNPLWNEIVFPAAILQPPFFDLDADDAVNYGGIGAVIGHEIGHGFDDKGRKFDSTGSMNDWWAPTDASAFEARKDALKAQYEQFEVLDGKTINGEFTSGENIGDLAGLSIAYRAYRMSLEGKEAPVIDGLTGDQRFFMGWAQVWRRLYTDAELERRLTVDPHSPSKARTNVIVRNIPAFYEAFDVKPGDAMYLAPEDRVRIW